jgi:NAD(P)-dependent dehydrogenase (short-subunit alcohol dehydrogenase family)
MTTNAVDEVKDKVAIVTGAASGIGRATTELLHARGAKVVAEDISPDVEKLERPGIATLVADFRRTAPPRKRWRSRLAASAVSTSSSTTPASSSTNSSWT